MKKLNKFFNKLSTCGIDFTLLQDALIEVGEYKKRKSPAILFPKTTQQVRQLINYAVEYTIPLYPYSKGNNWGFGSFVPVKNNTVLVDLGKLNNIRTCDHKKQIIVIEPGVTQQQLSDYLKDTKFMANLTSSSPYSSVLGNTLDNGIGYLGRKINDMVGVEMISGTGNLCQYGYLSTKLKSKDLTRYIPQTNFGIVTAIAIKLTRQPKHIKMITLTFETPSFNKISSLLKSYYQDGIIRWVSKISPIDHSLFYLLIPIITTSTERQKIHLMINQLKKLGKVQIYNEPKIRSLPTSNEFVGHWSLYHGQPNGYPTASYLPFKQKIVNLDQYSNTGIRLLAHITPLDTPVIKNIERIISGVSKESTCTVDYRLNILNKKSIALVMYIHFLRNKQGIKSAKVVSSNLFFSLMEYGYKPYRLNIDIQKNSYKQNLSSNFKKKIKKQLDPFNIISPGRYGF